MNLGRAILVFHCGLPLVTACSDNGDKRSGTSSPTASGSNANVSGASAIASSGTSSAYGGAGTKASSASNGGAVTVSSSILVLGGAGTSSGTAYNTAPAAGAVSTATKPYRPYADSSPWNTPIGSNPKLDPNSKALIGDFESSSQYGEHLDVNIEGYSVPLYWADANTPRVEVVCRVGGHGFTGDNGMNATARVPLPANAAPDPESDHHLLIVDRTTNTEYGMWDFSVDGGTYLCGLGAMQDLNGSGVRPLADTASPWWEAHGPRACGFGLIAGLIRPEEIKAGIIEHALVVAYPHIRSGLFVSPASTAQASNGVGAEPNRGIPCGGRIQYDPNIDVESLPVSRAGKVILRALQRYGAYVGDYSGAISLYADNSPEAQTYWKSIDFDSYELLDAIDLADFRVLEIGTMHDNGNG
jgi:hypothetical protein